MNAELIKMLIRTLEDVKDEELAREFCLDLLGDMSVEDLELLAFLCDVTILEKQNFAGESHGE